jgi:hypothetical protein
MKWQSGEYDLIILGSGLAGLIAGVCLKKESRRVLLLKEKGYHPSVVKEGYRFVPYSNLSEKRLKSALLMRLLKGLDLLPEGPSKRSKSGKQEAPPQVILPGARIDLYDDLSILRKEWKREFPKELPWIEEFYSEAARVRDLLSQEKREEGFFSVFPLRRPSLIKRLLPFQSLPKGRMEERLSRLSKEFSALVRLRLISLGNLYPERFPISLVDYLLLNDGRPEEGLQEIDMEDLKVNMLERFLQSGGLVEEIDEVERTEWRWRKGVCLYSRGKPFQSHLLLLNSPLHRISKYLGKKRKLLRKWEERIRPRYRLLPLFLGILEKVVPVGMGDLLVSVSDLDKPYERGNLLFISLSKEAPEGRVAMTVESPVPMENWDLSSLDEQEKGMMAHLCNLFPFLRDHIEFTGSFREGETLQNWSFSDFIYETPHDFRWREGLVPTRVSKNIYFSGKENFPYLGVEGEILSGYMVARQILEAIS